MKATVTNNGEHIFNIADYIPVGHANAIGRKYLASVTGLSDRQVRQEIEKSDAPIINMGSGYFVPDMNDAIDVSEMESYIAQERSRIRTLEEKLERKFGNIEAEEELEM